MKTNTPTYATAWEAAKAINAWWYQRNSEAYTLLKQARTAATFVMLEDPNEVEAIHFYLGFEEPTEGEGNLVLYAIYQNQDKLSLVGQENKIQKLPVQSDETEKHPNYVSDPKAQQRIDNWKSHWDVWIAQPRNFLGGYQIVVLSTNDLVQNNTYEVYFSLQQNGSELIGDLLMHDEETFTYADTVNLIPPFGSHLSGYQNLTGKGDETDTNLATYRPDFALWNLAYPLAVNQFTDIKPALAGASDHLISVFKDNSSNNIRISTSYDQGTIWWASNTLPNHQTDNPPAVYTTKTKYTNPQNPDAPKAPHTYIAYRSASSDNLTLISSNDNWNAPIDSRQKTAAGPSLCIIDDSVYCIYIDESYRLNLTKYLIESSRWTAPELLGGNKSDRSPSIATDGESIFCISKGYENLNVYLISFDKDNVQSLTTQRVSDARTTNSPSIEARRTEDTGSETTLYVAFTPYQTNKNQEGAFRILEGTNIVDATDNQFTWTKILETPPNSTAAGPSITFFEDHLHCLFRGPAGNEGLMKI